MWNYFKPLRRKLGLVTLAMACVCAVGFVRSGVKRDTLFARLFGSQVIMISAAGKLHIWLEVVSRHEKQLLADVVFQVDFDQQFLQRGVLALPVPKSSRKPSFRWSSANGPMKLPIDETATANRRLEPGLHEIAPVAAHRLRASLICQHPACRCAQEAPPLVTDPRRRVACGGMLARRRHR